MKKVFRINYIIPNTRDKEEIIHYSLLDNRRTFCNSFITLHDTLLNFDNFDWPVCKTCATKLEHFDEYQFVKKDDPI